MTPIMGQIDLLLARLRAGRCPPEEMERRLERVHQAIHRYLQRATILLNVSRITSGKLQLDLETLDLGRLLREAVDDFAEPARRAGVSISLDAPDRLEGTWDRLALEQIIDNLVSNALKYGGRTPVALYAEARDGCVHIQVRDHGDGIAPQDRQRVFERFERAVGRGDQNGGFGVGLWVVGQLVDAMGGTVAVDEPSGGGALFTVRLPRHAKELEH